MTWQPDYTTLADLKSAVRIGDTDDDAELTFAITAASRAIDQATNRQFGNTTAEARLFTARFDRALKRYVVDVDDIHTTSSLAVVADDDDDGVYDDNTWTLDAEDGFLMYPPNNADTARPWTQIVFRSDADSPPCAPNAIQVTAQFGWASVPVTIEAATILQAQRFFYRREAPFGVAGSPSVGSEIRLLSMVDPDVAVMVRPYRRVWGAV